MQIALPKLGTLRVELAAAGVFEFRELRSFGKLAVLLAMIAGGLTAIAVVGAWVAIPLLPMLAVACTSTAMLGHEGSHRSFSASPGRNATLAYFAFPLFSGLSTLYWREKHDRLHHGHPNVEGVDPDIKPFPFVSSRGDHERCGPKLRWFQRNLQRWAFWPMATLMALGMRRSSLLYVYRYAGRGRERGWWIEVVCLTVHYTAWLIVPLVIWGPIVLALYMALWGGVGVCLALVFAPAHMGMPLTSGQQHDWVHQLETTRNLQLSPVLSYFFIGLDYQVEHHLFPKIPHGHLPLAAQITSAWCRRAGLPYHSQAYLYALGDAARFISTAWSREAACPIEVRSGVIGADVAA